MSALVVVIRDDRASYMNATDDGTLTEWMALDVAGMSTAEIVGLGLDVARLRNGRATTAPRIRVTGPAPGRSGSILDARGVITEDARPITWGSGKRASAPAKPARRGAPMSREDVRAKLLAVIRAHPDGIKSTELWPAIGVDDVPERRRLSKVLGQLRHDGLVIGDGMSGIVTWSPGRDGDL